MCNHTYTANYKRMPRTMGERCPYPEFYERARSGTAGESVSLLPLDLSGACIFHSRDVAWKREHDFESHFLRLVQLLIAEPEAKHFDFAEFAFVGASSKPHTLRILDTVFPQKSYFTAASFLDPVTFEGVDFPNGANFSKATFAGDLQVTKAHFNGLELSGAVLGHLVSFDQVEIVSYAHFDDARFTGTAFGCVVRFEDCRFDAITDFSGASFVLGEESSVGFVRTRFEESADFQRARFHCQVVFSEVSFAGTTDFIDTSFDSVASAARYRGSAVEFNQIEITAGAILRFESTDPQRKLFDHDVQFSFKETPAGLIRFENVNFKNISPASRERLTELARSGRVEIGSGCIKYRFQTPITKIDVSEGNTPLIVKICETFTSYFTVSNGFNLGLEVVDRTRTKVLFFFFTDEDISEAIFEERLARTAQQMWSLLSIRSDDQLLALETSPALESTASLAPSVPQESAMINAVDCVTSMMSIFFGVGIRIACGKWKAADTRALRRAALFHDESPEIAAGLHRVLVERYTGATLAEISGRQNRELPPKLLEAPRPRATPRLLFVAVDPFRRDRLRLDLEAKAVEEGLRSAGREDRLAIEHSWAATFLDLQHALLRHRPALLHFSGHGTPSGDLALEKDLQVPTESRRPETSDQRPAEALARMLGAMEGLSVRCVVLNACFSEAQAAEVAQHADCVIGLFAEVRDSAAIEFARGFYGALAFGQSVQAAFELGVNQVKSRDDASLYRLIAPRTDPQTLKLVEAAERTTR